MNPTWLLIPALLGAVSLDDPGDAAFARGVRERSNAAEARPAFAQAAGVYREHWRGKHRSGVALAWGRAAYLSGDAPQAIAAFRSGLLHDPANTELLKGLSYCRGELNLPAPEDGIAGQLNSRTKALWAFAASAMLGFGIWCRFTVRWRIAFGFIIAGVLAGLGYGLWEWQCAQEKLDRVEHPAWVLREDTPLRTGNGETFTPRLPSALRAGTELRQLARRGGWVQVELPSGEAGWLPEESLWKVE